MINKIKCLLGHHYKIACYDQPRHTFCVRCRNHFIFDNKFKFNNINKIEVFIDMHQLKYIAATHNCRFSPSRIK